MGLGNLISSYAYIVLTAAALDLRAEWPCGAFFRNGFERSDE
jgi:hypothetical protein